MSTRDMRDRTKIIIFVVGLFLAVIVGIMIGLSLKKDQDITPNGPDVIENGATQITDDINDSTDEELENSASITFTKIITIDSSTGIADLLFALPSSTNMDSVISIVVNDETIIRSGRILSGYQVNNLKLLDPNKTIKKGSYNGTLIISFYDKGSNIENSVNTKIEVLVMVQ